MSTPSNESRISNLEKESMTLGARIEELATDTDGNFRTLRQEMKEGFLEMGNAFDLNAGTIEAVRQDLAEIKSLMLQLLQQKSGE